MFEPRVLNEIRKIVTCLGRRFILPFKWDNSKGLLLPIESNVQKTVSKIVFLHFIIHIIYTSVSLLTARKSGPEGERMKPAHLFFLVVMWAHYFPCFETQCSLNKRKFQMAIFFKEVVTSFQKFKSKLSLGPIFS